jgi:hypothetical protein
MAISQSRCRLRLAHVALVAVTLIAAFGSWRVALLPRPASAAVIVSVDGPRVYFPESGQTLGGAFLRKWAGELREREVGIPVTPPVQHDGAIVQWTEFARIEYRGSDLGGAAPEEVALAPIGRVYAEKLGYTRWVPAFRTTDAAGTDARFFYETGHSLANDFLRVYEQRGNDERLGAPISEEFRIGDVTYQFFEYGALAWDTVAGTRIVPLGRLDAALYGLGSPSDDYRPGDVQYSSANMLLLSDAFPGERWIEIDLTEHELIAWAGDFELMRTKVVTGPMQSPTPTGTFSIYLKYDIQNLSGIGWNGQPFYAPGTPWVMYFYQDYAVHGSTWRDTYGYGSGQGCVIPPNLEAELLWKWADYGTEVWVHY